MAMGLGDRLLTIVVTATITSAGWIVAGGMGLAPQVKRFPGTTAAPPAPLVTSSAAAHAIASNDGPLLIPVAGVKPEQLVDTFTQARAGGARVHDAIDIMAPEGTPVIAAAAGTIEKLFESKDGGTTIYMRSPDRRMVHYYAHLQAYAPGLHEGQAVDRGQPLGLVGSTGNANPSAPHLHFAMWPTTPEARWWDSGTAINPYPLLANHNLAPNRKTP